MATLLAKWKLLGRMINDPAFTRGDVAVAQNLLEMTNNSNVAWPSIGTIAKRSGQTVRNVTKSIAKLRDIGFMEITSGKRGRRVNVYRVLFPKDRDSVTAPTAPPADTAAEQQYGTGAWWRGVLVRFQASGDWPAGAGLKPPHPACRAPKALLAELGLRF